MRCEISSTPGEKKKALTRVRRVREQIDALERSLESDTKCRTILQQTATIRGMANGLMTGALENHTRETSGRDDCYSCEVSRSVDDTIELVRAYLE